MSRRPLLIVVLLSLAAGLTAAAAPYSSLSVVERYPHDPAAFTQGLLYYDGRLYESTGRYGHSTLRRVVPTTGVVERQVRLADRYFGEGLARVEGRLYQLTWKAGIVFVYDLATLERTGQFRYNGQGWGLTYDGARLIMSDGSATLQRIDPSDFSVIDRLTVHDGQRPIGQLNELEYIDGEIWANVWKRDVILRINAETGAVRARIDGRALRSAMGDAPDAGVLNGIAVDADSGRIYLTGKNWPALFALDAP